MGLGEPVTTCGVPLSSMAKFIPPSVLVKLQESPTGELQPCRVFIKGLKTPPQVLGPPLQGRD